MLMLLSHPQIHKTCVERYAGQPIQSVFRSGKLSSSSESPFSPVIGFKSWPPVLCPLQGNLLNIRSGSTTRNFFDAHIQVILSNLIHFHFSPACPLSFLPCCYTLNLLWTCGQIWSELTVFNASITLLRHDLKVLQPQKNKRISYRHLMGRSILTVDNPFEYSMCKAKLCKNHIWSVAH